MKRFVWRLQRVLGIKAVEEQTKRAELLGLTEALAQTRGVLFMEKRLLKDMISDIAGQSVHRRLGEQEFFLRHSGAIDAKIKGLETKVTALVTKQKEKIAEVLKVRRFKEGLEKMREEAKRQFISEQEKLEQKELDEGATIRFARKLISAADSGGAKD